MKSRDDFPLKTVVRVAERASYLCSNPACTRMTCGPCAEDGNRSAKAGVAAHICAAAPGGPRYDRHQTPAERATISNAIWLCGTCSQLIDKNNGVDFPAELLRRWKADHEALMKTLVDAGFNPLGSFPHSMSVAAPADIVKEVLATLEDRGVLFMPYNQEDPNYVALSIAQIRERLRSLRSRAPAGSAIDQRLKAMVEACRYYMNTTPPTAAPGVMHAALGGLRKVFGVHLKQMAAQYGILLDANLSSMLPSD